MYILSTTAGVRKGKIPYSVRSNLRSSHRSAGMDDILVPDSVLEMKKPHQSLLRCTKAQAGTDAAFNFTHRLSRLLVDVRMGKSCIMLAPRSILKHTR